jgi:hypothetical protein
MHEPIEHAIGVGQSKRDDHPLIQTMLHLECGFPLISKPNTDMMIPALMVNFGEYLRA